jgi:ATP-dependent DNA helicase RecQ
VSLIADPLSILHEVFGYAEFRGEQRSINDHVAGGGDALVLMPTGGGKSLCYQVPAIHRHRGGRGGYSDSPWRTRARWLPSGGRP